MAKEKDIVQKYVDELDNASKLLSEIQNKKVRFWNLLWRKPFRDFDIRISTILTELVKLDKEFFGAQRLPTNVNDGNLNSIQVTTVTSVRASAIHTISEVRVANTSNENLLNFSLSIVIALVALVWTK